MDGRRRSGQGVQARLALTRYFSAQLHAGHKTRAARCDGLGSRGGGDVLYSYEPEHGEPQSFMHLEKKMSCGHALCRLSFRGSDALRRVLLSSTPAYNCAHRQTHGMDELKSVLKAFHASVVSSCPASRAPGIADPIIRFIIDAK